MMAQQFSRQLNSRPTTHRLGVLQAIAKKAHSTTAKICHMQVKTTRLQQLMEEAPQDTPSRIDWMQKHLNASS